MSAVSTAYAPRFCVWPPAPLTYLNPESVVVRTGCKLEESLKDAKPGEKFQFVRTGFFTPDSKNPGVYNRVVTLRDSFKPAK